MGEHAEIMEEAHITRSEYLSAMRKQQPIEELERKAKKAARLKGNIWTQEQIDLHIAWGNKLLLKMVSPAEC
jgi:hypothetical protein